jgi:hypothetical protein
MLQYQEDNELPVGERSWLHAHLTTGDVLLVVAPQMMDAACAGHDRPLFMDATHGTVKYGYKLVAVLVMDQMNKGVPVAWAIVDERTVDYTKFLQVLKDEILRRLQTLTRSGSQACTSLTMLRAEHAATRCATHAVYCFLPLRKYGIATPLTSWRHSPQQQCQEQAYLIVLKL